VPDGGERKGDEPGDDGQDDDEVHGGGSFEYVIPGADRSAVRHHPDLPSDTGPLIRSGVMVRSKTSSELELLVPLNRDADEPLHRQLEQELRDAIRNGRLAAGATIPSSRALAAELGLSRGST
jgi:hypothetical protein